MRRVPSGRALAWGLMVFAAIQVGLGFVIAVWRPDVRDPQFHLKADRLYTRLAAAPHETFRILALGTSRMSVGFSACLAEREIAGRTHQSVLVHNLGVAGSGVLSEIIYLNRLKSVGVRPDVVVIEVLPVQLVARGATTEFSRLPGSRIAWSDAKVLSRYGAPGDELPAEWAMSWLIPANTHRESLLNLLRRPPSDPASHIDAWGQRRWNETAFKSAIRQQQMALTLKHYEGVLTAPVAVNPRLVEPYRELLEICRREKIAAVLVWMPEGPAFRSLYPPLAEEIIADQLRQLGEEAGVSVVDAHDWPMSEDDFRDSHHLFAGGADRFTSMLVDRLFEIGVIGGNGRLLTKRGIGPEGDEHVDRRQVPTPER